MSEPPPTLSDLGALVRARREGELRIGRRKAAQAGEMSPVTWQRVEEGETVQALSYSGVEAALGWTRGAIRRYLDGGPAPTAEDDDATPQAAPTIFDASFDQLLDEVRRRHALMRDELERRLYPMLAAADQAETADSVRARGMIPGLPMSERREGDDVAKGGGQ